MVIPGCSGAGRPSWATAQQRDGIMRQGRLALRPRPGKPAGELGHSSDAVKCDFGKACRVGTDSPPSFPSTETRGRPLMTRDSSIPAACLCPVRSGRGHTRFSGGLGPPSPSTAACTTWSQRLWQWDWERLCHLGPGPLGSKEQSLALVTVSSPDGGTPPHPPNPSGADHLVQWNAHALVMDLQVFSGTK